MCFSGTGEILVKEIHDSSEVAVSPAEDENDDDVSYCELHPTKKIAHTCGATIFRASDL